MQTNTEINHHVMYKQVKEKISGTLQEQSSLQEDTIQTVIEEWKKLIEGTPPMFLKTILGIDEKYIRP
ncbi:MAG: hypothetical protein AB2401_07595, partial [Bacillus sp. (in: firmicutes)]